MVRAAGSDALGNNAAYLHFPVWYQAERGGLVEFSFAAFYPMLLRFSSSHATFVPEQFASRPTNEAVAREVGRFDHVLTRVSPSDTAAMIGVPVTLVRQTGEWRLYDRTDR